MENLEDELSIEMDSPYRKRRWTEVPIRVFEKGKRISTFWYYVNEKSKKIKLKSNPLNYRKTKYKKGLFYAIVELESLVLINKTFKNIASYDIKHSWWLKKKHKRMLKSVGLKREYKDVLKYSKTLELYKECIQLNS